METYTVIKKGSSIRHCIKIPEEFLEENLEITIKPYKPKRGKRVTVPFHSGKILHPKVLKSILSDAGVTEEELINLL